MRITAFEPDYDPKHRTVLRAFVAGIPGAHVRPVDHYVETDVAVIFGMVKRAYPPTWTKQAVLDRHHGRSLIVLESAFVKRPHWWAAGFGGQHGGAEFPVLETDPDIFSRFGVVPKPWARDRSGPVVVFGQLQRDTNVQDTDHYAWCREMVARVQASGQRCLFRPHPREKRPAVYGIDPAIMDRRPLEQTLAEARAAITFNSTSAVDCVLAGVPVVTWSPRSYSRDVAVDIRRVLDGGAFDFLPPRREFFKRLGYSQWSLMEFSNGTAWRHLARWAGRGTSPSLSVINAR